jgi:subtilisin family serine protease
MILRELIEEAAARGVYRLGAISFGYNATAPTSGSWSTEVDLTMQVGSPLGVVAADVVDLGHDLWLNPSTLELEAWESRGTDRSATVVFDTGVNLIGYTTQVERPLKTVALVRSKDGWLRVANNTLRTANGWRETFLEYGSTRSEVVARRQAHKHLARTGKTQIAASGVEVAVVVGAVPYVDFDVADVVSVPDATGSGALTKARVLSISLSESGGALRFVPELEVITSA